MKVAGSDTDLPSLFVPAPAGMEKKGESYDSY
jgi:hypothetical protein